MAKPGFPKDVDGFLFIGVQPFDAPTDWPPAVIDLWVSPEPPTLAKPTILPFAAAEAQFAPDDACPVPACAGGLESGFATGLGSLKGIGLRVFSWVWSFEVPAAPLPVENCLRFSPELERLARPMGLPIAASEAQFTPGHPCRAAPLPSLRFWPTLDWSLQFVRPCSCRSVMLPSGIEAQWFRVFDPKSATLQDTNTSTVVRNTDTLDYLAVGRNARAHEVE